MFTHVLSIIPDIAGGGISRYTGVARSYFNNTWVILEPNILNLLNTFKYLILYVILRFFKSIFVSDGIVQEFRPSLILLWKQQTAVNWNFKIENIRDFRTSIGSCLARYLWFLEKLEIFFIFNNQNYLQTKVTVWVFIILSISFLLEYLGLNTMLV